MQNNTSNTTVDINNESLEDYIKSLTDVIFYDNDIDNDRKDFYELGAKAGSNWQKEKDKANYDKLVSFIEEMAKRYESSEWIGGEAKKLLNQL